MLNMIDMTEHDFLLGTLVDRRESTWRYRVARPKELKIENPRRFSNFSKGHMIYMMTAEKLTMPECRMKLRLLSRN
jgi:hypothetical protein